MVLLRPQPLSLTPAEPQATLGGDHWPVPHMVVLIPARFIHLYTAVLLGQGKTEGRHWAGGWGPAQSMRHGPFRAPLTQLSSPSNWLIAK